MRRILWVTLLAGCYDAAPRREFDEDWERYRNAPVPEGNVRVNLEYFEYEASDRAALSVALGAQIAWSSNGLGAVADARIVADIRASWQRERTRSHRSSTLLVADGFEGEMAVVQEVPAAVAHVIPVYDGAVVVRSIEVVAVGSGFRVQPKRAGGKVALKLTPWVRDAKRGMILVTELSANLLVEAGRPVVIFEHEARRESLGTLFFARGARRVMMVVTVE